ncbi:TnsA endonuclease N-terminal domain-containing protein [Burkholderia vietnamiensis]|uniref:TnsA endonuclease N-terminal domain-containing protein n=1 Tax=Burkholderia vietnamiensis TaxID=60552 RepID=UPI001CF154CC|nr:TnsA endonuclease N-terminal domain-containing protein [Burkholderia vietnamiensis]MCA8287320.1 TnsA endonuclease N-terminal domain-containing protein [Burkholderia vietnamiensis]
MGNAAKIFDASEIYRMSPTFEHSGIQRILCPDMPCYDERNIPLGRMYRPFIEAKDTTLGVGFSVPGVKAARTHEYLSLLERKLHFLLELRHGVVDFREQYPLYDIDKLRSILANNPNPSRTSVMTIDVLVTETKSGWKDHRHTGLSVKYSNELTRQTTWRRLIREKEFCLKQGWGWSLVTEQHVDEMKWRMSRRIWRWMKNSDGGALADDAARIASILNTGNVRSATADMRLSVAAKKMGCDLNQAYRLFGIAAVLGYVRVDTTQHIGPRWPLAIVEGSA